MQLPPGKKTWTARTMACLEASGSSYDPGRLETSARITQQQVSGHMAEKQGRRSETNRNVPKKPFHLSLSVTRATSPCLEAGFLRNASSMIPAHLRMRCHRTDDLTWIASESPARDARWKLCQRQAYHAFLPPPVLVCLDPVLCTRQTSQSRSKFTFSWSSTPACFSRCPTPRVARRTCGAQQIPRARVDPGWPGSACGSQEHTLHQLEVGGYPHCQPCSTRMLPGPWRQHIGQCVAIALQSFHYLTMAYLLSPSSQSP